MLCTSLWFFTCDWVLFFCFCFCFSHDSHEAALSNILEVQVELLNNYGEHQNWRILNCFIHFFIFSFKKPKTMQRKHTIQFQKLQRKRWIKWNKKVFFVHTDWLTWKWWASTINLWESKVTKSLINNLIFNHFPWFTMNPLCRRNKQRRNGRWFKYLLRAHKKKLSFRSNCSRQSAYSIDFNFCSF